MDKIEVEYLILKRKLYENIAYPQKGYKCFRQLMVNQVLIRLWQGYKSLWMSVTMKVEI